MEKLYVFSKGNLSNFMEADRLKNNINFIPDSPGIYALISKKDNALYYVGQAKGKLIEKPRSIQDRFKKEHFKKRARGSALRRHIALELNIPLFKDHSGHNAVDPIYEDRISDFLEKDLKISFITAPWTEVDALEVAAIQDLKPKWNTQHANI